MVLKHKNSADFQPSDYLVHRYVAKVSNATTLDDVLHPQYFENYLNLMRPGMEVTVLSDDYSLDVKLRVIKVTKTEVFFRVLEDYSNEPVVTTSLTDEEKQAVTVKWAGPNAKYRVMNGTQVIQEGIATKEEAAEELEKYLASLEQ